MNPAAVNSNWSGSDRSSLRGLTRDQAAAGFEIVDNLLGLVCGCEACKTGEGKPVPGEKEMLELLLVEWGNGSKDAVKKATALLNAKAGELTKREMTTLLKVIPKSLAAKFVAPVSENLPKIMTGGYRRAKKSLLKGSKAKMLWAEIDDEATAWLYDHHMYWIGNYYDKHVSEYLSNAVAEGLAEGLGREAIGNKLADFFDDYPGVRNKPLTYWRGFAANGMNRSRNFGLIQGYTDVGVKQLEVLAILDERTSAICRELNGRIIPVSRAAGQRDALMAAEDPEDVKTIAPWIPVEDVTGKSTRYIMDQGVIMPPYHFHCRTTVVERA